MGLYEVKDSNYFLFLWKITAYRLGTWRWINNGYDFGWTIPPSKKVWPQTTENSLKPYPELNCFLYMRFCILWPHAKMKPGFLREHSNEFPINPT